MFTPWADIDRAFPGFDFLRRRVDDPNPQGFFWIPSDSGPRASWQDLGDQLEIVLEVPGFAESDLKVDVVRDGVTISGERKPTVPEGHRALRRERATLAFNRSFSLPVPVDPSQVSATLKHGLLSVRLPKVSDVRPRSIPVASA